jgi:predicted Rossmann fold flavoprotein
MTPLPVVVIGAGAAGLMAARFAAEEAGPDLPVILLERTSDGGRKILISGGGRCNVLPSRADASDYVTASSPNTLRKMLASWPLAEQRRFFEDDLGIRLALEPETGKLFPESNRARDVRDLLVSEVRRRGAKIGFDASVEGLVRGSEEEPWRVLLAGGREIAAAAVVVATGGLSVPKTGSDGTGLNIVRTLGHTLHPTYPALTPLTATPPPHAGLAGVSLDVRIEAPVAKTAYGTVGGSRERGAFVTTGGFLFTHRGYSGPSVLNVSHLAVLSRIAGGARQPVRVRWTAHGAPAWERMLLERGGGSVAGLLRRHLPTRLADALLAEAELPTDRALAQLRRDERARVVELLTAYPLPWTGDEGYRKAEVTGGGVPLGEVDPTTLESRIRPGLFLCGEILDAFGPIGGYNFLWAWATGRAAGIGVAARARVAGRAG